MTTKSKAWNLCIGLALLLVALVMWGFKPPAPGEDFSDAVRAMLQDHIDLERKSTGMVVGIIDEHGSKIISYGKRDHGQSPDVDGDTVFEIGSTTKTFTALLLQQLVDQGEMKLDDPVAKYLPASVKMPTHGGKQITLLHLATHTSGLPDDPDNYAPRDWNDPYTDYSAEMLYSFLSSYTLTRDPGSQWQYSNVGMGLLGHIIALRTGKSYETLVANWICSPLGMDSTRISLSPDLKARSVVGHSCYGDAQSDLIFSEVLMGGGALHSTANDLLKYLSANLDLSHSPLTAIMSETHNVRFQNQGLGWAVSGDTLFHNGMTLGCTSSMAFDTKQRRGVVILSNQAFDPEAQNLVSILLRSEWKPENRPRAISVDDRTLDSYVGQYQSSDKRTVAVRREGHRLLVQLPTIPLLELLPKSKTEFFLRVSCRPVTFQQDAQGTTQTMSADFDGAQSTFNRISDLPPAPLLVPSPPVIMTETPESQADFLGTYMLPSKRVVTVSREGDHLLVVYQGWMGFHAYPESESRICCTYVPWEATLERNGGGEPTGITLACPIFEKQFIGQAAKIVPK